MRCLGIDYGTRRIGLSYGDDLGVATPLPVYVDVSLRDFPIVYPAGGSRNASVEVAPDRLFELVGKRWVDICRLPD